MMVRQATDTAAASGAAPAVASGTGSTSGSAGTGGGTTGWPFVSGTLRSGVRAVSRDLRADSTGG